MPAMDYAAIGEPVSEADPCGPDLDLEGDPNFLQFMARVESLLPASYFTYEENGRAVPFDRSAEGFRTEYAKLSAVAATLLESTRDLRLLAICCRLHALDRDLPGCTACLGAIARLVGTHWEEVHPRGEDGDFGYRVAVLQALDDAPTMILPLQHLPLFTHRRFGPISLRTAAVANGTAQARDGEAALDGSDLDRALREADPAAVEAAAAEARRLRAAALSVAQASSREAGGRNAVNLDRLVAVADGMLACLAGGEAAPPPAEARDEPAAEAASAEAAAPGPRPAVGTIADFRDAAAALAAVIAYFDAFERSSPAALLVRQAARLIGLPFHEVIRTLLPNHAEDATIYIGPTPEKSFEIRVDRMTEGSDESDEADMPPDDAEAADAAPPRFAVASRPEAIALLRQVGGFYRVREPASPIPLFTDRACAMADKDFLTILSDVLPGVRLARESD